MNEAGAYCSERICFQKPIGHISAIQQHLVEMETILDNVRTRLYKVTTMLDKGQSTRLESALLKSYACQNLTKVAEHALSIYAGIGYTKEINAGRIWNDLKGYEFAGGTNRNHELYFWSSAGQKIQAIVRRRVFSCVTEKEPR